MVMFGVGRQLRLFSYQVSYGWLPCSGLSDNSDYSHIYSIMSDGHVRGWVTTRIIHISTLWFMIIFEFAWQHRLFPYVFYYGWLSCSGLGDNSDYFHIYSIMADGRAFGWLTTRVIPISILLWLMIMFGIGWQLVGVWIYLLTTCCSNRWWLINGLGYVF